MPAGRDRPAVSDQPGQVWRRPHLHDTPIRGLAPPGLPARYAALLLLLLLRPQHRISRLANRPHPSLGVMQAWALPARPPPSKPPFVPLCNAGTLPCRCVGGTHTGSPRPGKGEGHAPLDQQPNHPPPCTRRFPTTLKRPPCHLSSLPKLCRCACGAIRGRWDLGWLR
jgi:hypothetical protein